MTPPPPLDDGVDVVLAGDIGGTNARFRLARADAPGEPLQERVLARWKEKLG